MFLRCVVQGGPFDYVAYQVWLTTPATQHIIDGWRALGEVGARQIEPESGGVSRGRKVVFSF